MEIESEAARSLAPTQFTRIAQPYHVTLTKNTKGYNWEVSVYSETVDDALSSLEFAEKELKARYGNREEEA